MRVSLPIWSALSVALVVSGCAKKRGEEAPAPPAATATVSAPAAAPQRGPKKGISPDKMCRYESATATSQLEITQIAALDLPMTQVKEALVCSGGALQECAGSIAQKHDPVKGDAAYALTVDKRGFVTDVKLESAGGVAKDVTSCAETILRKIEFPDSDKEATEVRLTLRYSVRDPNETTRFAGIRVTGAPPTITAGKIEAEKAMGNATGKVRACYVLALEGNDKIAGTVKYKVTIGAGGKVESADEEQSGNLPVDLLKCVDVVLRSTTFPPPENAAKASIQGSWTLGREGK